MTDKKRLDRERQIDPLENVLQARTPEGAQLGPYPADDLVATPAPRPSLSGIVAELEGEGAGRLRACMRWWAMGGWECPWRRIRTVRSPRRWRGSLRRRTSRRRRRPVGNR